jgi:hypothetical protein
VKLSRIAHVGLALLAGALVVMTSQPATAAEGATVTRVDLGAATQVSCALGGAGEEVVVQGTIHTVLIQTTDSAGGTHFVLRVNYSGMTGTGLTSGTIYRAVATEGSTSHDFDPFVGPPYSFTSTTHVRFVGRGPGNDFTVVSLIHVTVNAQDQVTAELQELRVDCGSGG